LEGIKFQLKTLIEKVETGNFREFQPLKFGTEC
jgi:hypothetical protein